MDERTIFLIVNGVGFGLVLFLIRRWIVNLDKKVDFFISAHHTCQRELPDKYARREDISKIFQKLDEQGKCIRGIERYLNGKMNGAKQ
jgi:hypothetical protein